jgi:hypothetical protein
MLVVFTLVPYRGQSIIGDEQIYGQIALVILTIVLFGKVSLEFCASRAPAEVR